MRRKNRKITIVLLLILALGVGFAIVTTNLRAHGTLFYSGMTFEVQMINASLSEKTIADGKNTENPLISNDGTELTINPVVNLEYPDYSFYVTVKNTGTLQATYQSIEFSGLNQDYIDYEIKYKDYDKIPTSAEFLVGQEQITYKVTLMLKDGILEIPEEGLACEINMTINYVAGESIYSIFDGMIGPWKEFDFVEKEQEYVIQKTGRYKLEAWGAQGGNLTSEGAKYLPIPTLLIDGGYGGYSSGEVLLEKGEVLHIYTGGQGIFHIMSDWYAPGGFNGGGEVVGLGPENNIATGGGATHIALVGGKLVMLEDQIDKILLVAGGGSGSNFYSMNYRTIKVGHGGGFVGGTGESYALNNEQEYPTYPGAGQDLSDCNFGEGINFGGGGFCGGTRSGGSGYIANPRIENGEMVCYDCPTSTELTTKTTKVAKHSSQAISRVPKEGNGKVRISYIGEE